jgi:hypothetical protein
MKARPYFSVLLWSMLVKCISAHLGKIVLVVACLLGNPALAQAPAYFALLDVQMKGAKGNVRLMQLHEADSWLDCQLTLITLLTRKTTPQETSAALSCVKSLPPELQGLVSGVPLVNAYHLRSEIPPSLPEFLVPKSVIHSVFFYYFDPGPPDEVCKRMREKMEAVSANVTCRQPRPT